MRGWMPRTMRGSRVLRTSTSMRRHRSGRMRAATSPSCAGPKTRTMGRFCKKPPHKSSSPWRAISSATTTTPALGTAVTRESRRMTMDTPSSRSVTTACGSTSSSDMATWRPSRKTRRHPTSTRIKASSFEGGRMARAESSSRRSACRSHCSTCMARASLGRESSADKVPTSGASLPSARTMNRRKVMPPSTCANR